MGAIAPWHIVVLFAIVLLVLGPGRLPDLGRAVGQTMRELRTAARDLSVEQPVPAPREAADSRLSGHDDAGGSASSG